MILVNKLSKVKSNFPVLVGKKALSARDCETLINEIKKKDKRIVIIQNQKKETAYFYVLMVRALLILGSSLSLEKNLTRKWISNQKI